MSQHLSMIAFMFQRVSMIALVGITAACGSDPASGKGGGAGADAAANAGGALGTGGAGPVTDAAESTPRHYDACMNSSNGPCGPNGFPFVDHVGLYTEWCGGIECLGSPPAGGATTIRLSQPESGALCLSGTVPIGGFAGLILSFTIFSELPNQKVLRTLNADALRIAQMAFTLDRPPPNGVELGFDTIRSVDCQGMASTSSNSCVATGPSLPMPITASGRTTASFADFRFSDDLGKIAGTRAVSGVKFQVDDATYDFCIRDFQLLDAGGVPVKE
jgi:hypothetical protein